ncbi:MAG: hypothetical protein RIF32_13920, partial [Leptospirales bacterium]
LGLRAVDSNAGYKFEIVHRDMEGERRARNDAGANATAAKIDEDRLAVKGFVNISDEARVAGFAPGGRVEFDLNLNRNARGVRRAARGPRLWELRGGLRASALQIRFANQPWSGAIPAPSPQSATASENAAAPVDALHFQTMVFDWGHARIGDAGPEASRGGRSDRDEFRFEARGDFAGGESSIRATGRLELQPTPDRTVPVKIVSDLNVEAGLSDARIESALDFMRRRYQNVRRLGYDPESRRAEDAGPLWQNKFFESDFYRTVIESLRVRARLKIRSAIPKTTLPPELAFVGRAENGYIRIESENGSNGGRPDQPEFQLKYESNLQSLLPRQDLQLRAGVPNNRLSFAVFTADPTPPGEFDLRYLMGGEGILPGDLMQRTYSRLELKARRIRLGRNRLLDIIRHEAGLPGEEFMLSSLDLTRSTDGSESSLRLRAAAPDILNVEGQGENLAGIGGSLQLRFRYPGEPGADRALRFRIRPDGGYIPEL